MENIFNHDRFRANLLNLLNIESYDHLNKAKFAESIGLQADAIKKITSGATQNPGIKTIVAIANKLGCSIDDLVGHTPKKTTTTEIVSKDLELNEDLFNSSISYIYNYINKHNLCPKIGEFLYILDSIYDYSFRRNLKQPDLEFANWIISATFKT